MAVVTEQRLTLLLNEFTSLGCVYYTTGEEDTSSFLCHLVKGGGVKVE